MFFPPRSQKTPFSGVNQHLLGLRNSGLGPPSLTSLPGGGRQSESCDLRAKGACEDRDSLGGLAGTQAQSQWLTDLKFFWVVGLPTKKD